MQLFKAGPDLLSVRREVALREDVDIEDDGELLLRHASVVHRLGDDRRCPGKGQDETHEKTREGLRQTLSDLRDGLQILRKVSHRLGEVEPVDEP